MSDRFQPLTTAQLTDWIFDELEHHDAVFGVHRDHLFLPSTSDAFATELYGQRLETPFGVAAGPHSQMAQNIIVAWLRGARFIELKTVQTLDELDIAKPCIDMRDEGYNVEWSQELAIDQSFTEYLRAWVLIHALHAKLGFPGDRPGVIFNMSVGYDLAGIQKPNVRRFLERMANAGEELEQTIEVVKKRAPELASVDVPSCISDNVTVSTMHGCPPDEIGKICHHLMDEWRLHTNVKLNPTLLGPERVRNIINERLGFDHITVPDIAFEHDLKYPDALELLIDLDAKSHDCGVRFGVKLCNTLEVVNHAFEKSAGDMMYMSGRPHHALAVNIADQLAKDLTLPSGDELLMSFAGGADAWNVVDLLAAGMCTVTTCSDILKPGGYGRLLQYTEETAAALESLGAGDLRELSNNRAAALGLAGDGSGAQRCLSWYADHVLEERRFKRDTYEREATKTARPLELFDCISAPCSETCPIEQQVPRYLSLIAERHPAEAAEVIREDNVMGAILGRACNHACELTCVRAHYDEPVAIRELKRFAMDHEKGEREPSAATARDERVAIVGGGPCGLSAAAFLQRAGVGVTVFEAGDQPGGMVSGSIPAYRATQPVLDQDLEYLKSQGVEVELGVSVGKELTLEELRTSKGYASVLLAAGAQRGMPLDIPGIDGEGVLDGLDFLRDARRQKITDLAKGPVGIIGGGDVAMDCARTASRLAPGRVTVIYRRTIGQMPAQREELQGLLEEGIPLLELRAPEAVIRDDTGKLVALECQPMVLGEADASGRRRPVPAEEGTVKIPLATLIVAIGQQPDLDFLGELELAQTRKGYLAVDPATLETSAPGLYAGGDLVGDGPETIVKALGDGKKVAAAILARLDGAVDKPTAAASRPDVTALIEQRSRRIERVHIPEVAPEARGNFEEIVETLSGDDAVEEASRCLRCDLLCSLCATVCPNLAFVTYTAEPFAAQLPTYIVKGGSLEVTGDVDLTLRQPVQVAVVTDFCNECGNCAIFCPTSGAPYRDKPRIYISTKEFEAQTDNAFLLERRGTSTTLLARSGGETHRLTLNDELHYESPAMRARLTVDASRVLDVHPGKAAKEGQSLTLEMLGPMLTLARALNGPLSHIPTATKS